MRLLRCRFATEKILLLTVLALVTVIPVRPIGAFGSSLEGVSCVSCKSERMDPDSTVGRPAKRSIAKSSDSRARDGSDGVASLGSADPESSADAVISSSGASSFASKGAAQQVVANYNPAGFPQLMSLPSRITGYDAEVGFVDQNGRRLELTLDSFLQERATLILERNRVPWGAIVALDPKTGRVLALAGHSSRDPSSSNVALRGSFPAASLFKLITAAAAVERAGVDGEEIVRFRGGNYTLGPSNYLPIASRDSRSMSVSDALGKSCNPVFAHLALNKLSTESLAQYAVNFGFNSTLPFEASVEASAFSLPADSYSFARTAAGFGDVQLSPLHAAVITGTLANGGEMMRPYLVSRVVGSDGNVLYQSRSARIRKSVLASTAREVLDMMVSTVSNGTARKQFKNIQQKLPNYQIAAKTGTLTGSQPDGLYTWFVAAAPVENPQLAIASLVIDPGNARVKGSALGRQFMEQYLASQGMLTPKDLKARPVTRVASPSKKRSRKTSAVRKSSRSSVQVARSKPRVTPDRES